MQVDDLWAIAIGEREQFQETSAGLERLHAVPLLLLHGRRVAACAGRAVAEQALAALRPRFPDARLLPFPGGPADARVITAADCPELLTAYGLLPRPVPPELAPALAWARATGAPDAEAPLPPAVAALLPHPHLVPSLVHALARGEVGGQRALALLAAAATPAALDFLAWALAADDAEFQAKYGRRGQEAIAAIAFLPDHAAAEFTRRMLWDGEHEYPWRVPRACVERLMRLGPAGLQRLVELRSGHRLENYIRRWMNLCQKEQEPPIQK